MNQETTPARDDGSRAISFRRAVLRGLGVVLPPLLTIVVLIWAWNTIESYVLRPIESGFRHAIVWNFNSTFSSVPPDATAKSDQGFTYKGTRYVADPTGRRYIPEFVKTTVDESDYDPYAPAPLTANAYWHR